MKTFLKIIVAVLIVDIGIRIVNQRLPRRSMNGKPIGLGYSGMPTGGGPMHASASMGLHRHGPARAIPGAAAALRPRKPN